VAPNRQRNPVQGYTQQNHISKCHRPSEASKSYPDHRYLKSIFPNSGQSSRPAHNVAGNLTHCKTWDRRPMVSDSVTGIQMRTWVGQFRASSKRFGYVHRSSLPVQVTSDILPRTERSILTTAVGREETGLPARMTRMWSRPQRHGG
jgi:hypothetical protein